MDLGGHCPRTENSNRTPRVESLPGGRLFYSRFYRRKYLNQLAKNETGNLIREYGLEGLPLSGILQESINSGVIARHEVPWQSRWGCGEGFVSPHPPPTEIASSLPLLATTVGIIPRLLRGVYPEPDSSVASLPQNDRGRRARNDSMGLPKLLRPDAPRND